MKKEEKILNNPYEVLGINKGASQDEVKAAYRKLIKQYHPDQYVNNPLADLAQEKLKEINAAYDAITRGEASSYTSGRSQSSQSGQNNQQNQRYSQNTNQGQRNTQSQGGTSYNQIRRAIEANNLSYAEQMLDSVMNRDAEWNYLKGIVSLRKGWYDQALRYITVANSLDPGNVEYQSALTNLHSRNNTYKQQGNYRGYNNGGSFCDVCSTLLIADCCCECMGGDLIACC